MQRRKRIRTDIFLQCPNDRARQPCTRRDSAATVHGVARGRVGVLISRRTRVVFGRLSTKTAKTFDAYARGFNRTTAITLARVRPKFCPRSCERTTEHRVGYIRFSFPRIIDENTRAIAFRKTFTAVRGTFFYVHDGPDTHARNA